MSGDRDDEVVGALGRVVTIGVVVGVVVGPTSWAEKGLWLEPTG